MPAHTPPIPALAPAFNEGPLSSSADGASLYEILRPYEKPPEYEH